MESILPIIQNLITSLASFWTWFTTPLNFGALNYMIPTLLRTPATILTMSGLVAILIINIIAKVLSATPLA